MVISKVCFVVRITYCIDIFGRMSSPALDERPKSKRPKDTKFKQQKLPAWQPIMTAGTVLPAFFAIGVAFIPLGVALLITTNSIQEHQIDYTKCKPKDPNLASYYSSCDEVVRESNVSGITCTCEIEFELGEFKGNVYMYYGLTNFYQNHRRYVKSRDDEQLIGKAKTPDQLNDDCQPYKQLNSSLGYAPCGAIANSMFNDSMKLIFKGDGKRTDIVGLLNTNIAWTTDKNVKFKNPENMDSALKNFIPPPNWQKDVRQLDPSNPDNNGYQNEDLIVWMRTAALPTFRKLYRRVNHTGIFYEGLPKGKYILEVDYAYPVTSFDGTKRMILTTTTWLGGKNPFLGIAYLVVGSLCIILGAVFVIIHIRVGKKPSQLLETTNTKTPYIEERH